MITVYAGIIPAPKSAYTLNDGATVNDLIAEMTNQNPNNSPQGYEIRLRGTRVEPGHALSDGDQIRFTNRLKGN